jgi:molecular chaperone HtpG
LGDSSKPETSPAEQAEIGMLVARVKEILGDRVIDVRGSERLVNSPCCLVTDDAEMSVHMDKVMRMINKAADLPKRVLELNPQHSLIRNLARLVEKDKDDPFVTRACQQLFEGAMLVDGYLADPHLLLERMNQILDDAAKLKAGDAKP